MIEITRRLARQVRAFCRKAVPAGNSSVTKLHVVFQTDGDGLRIRALHPEVGLEYHLAGSRPSETIVLPVEALADFEGTRDDLVTLSAIAEGVAQAGWRNGGVPQIRDYHPADAVESAKFPAAPEQFTPTTAAFLKALAEAALTVSSDNPRYAMQRIQLRGRSGEVVATDGRQCLVRNGFALPWQEDLLIPASGLFGYRELTPAEPLQIGRTTTHVVLQVGSWKIFLAIDDQGRYPNIDHVTESLGSGGTTCHIDPQDAAFLIRALPHLPGKNDEHLLITLDLNGQVALRARDEGQSRATEVILSRSSVTGAPVRFTSNRKFVARAMHLGFTEFHVTKPDVPVICHAPDQRYVWMPLGHSGAIGPGEDCLRIASNPDEAVPSQPVPERSEPIVTTPAPKPSPGANGPPPNPPAEGDVAQATGINALLTEAEELRDTLRNAFDRSNRLLSALKRYRRQSRLVATTLASLRQLQQIEN